MPSAQLEGCTSRGASGLDVVYGDAGAGQCPHHTVAGGHTTVGGAAIGRLDIPDPDARLAQGGPHRHDAHGRAGHTFEPPEGVDPDAGDAHVVHERNTHVTTGWPSGPGSSSPSSRTGQPGANPSPASRLSTRKRGEPSSSTTPKP